MLRIILKLPGRNKKSPFLSWIETLTAQASCHCEAPLRRAGQAFFIIAFFLFASLPSALLAQEPAKIYKTQYAGISFTDDKDIHTFTVNIGTGISFLGESPEKNPLLAKNRVDRIVDGVCKILDMRPLNLQFGIVLHKTQAEVSAAYRATGMMGPSPIAFYSHRTRSIAVMIENITDRILAHEIAHAVICVYFGVPPPANMQEILAQYVDKHLWDQ